MILNALCDYYDLKKDSMPGFGTEFKEIHFVIVIDSEGRFVRFEDLRDAKKKRGQQFNVRRAVVRASGVKANYLYDNGTYVLGLKDEGKAAKRANAEAEKLLAFAGKIFAAAEALTDNQELKALAAFYRAYMSPDRDRTAMESDPLWNDVKAAAAQNMTFRLNGDTEIIAEKAQLISLDTCDETPDSDVAEAICLITGTKCHPVVLTAATMIPGSQATAKIVSFQTSQGYDSYGKSQCHNAPISPEAEFKFSSALKHLLGSRRNKFLLANRTFLFWSTCKDKDTESSLDLGLMALFGSRDLSPDTGVNQIKDIFTAIYSGKLKTAGDDRFYILGLAPNSARIAVSYWAEMSVKEFAAHILRHFDDMDISDSRGDDKPYAGLYNMVAACISEEKVSDCKTKMPEQIAKSIFSGTPYPMTMLSGCINRLRASKPLTRTRAAIMKAYLNRNTNNQTPISPMLNADNTNPGYLCGRLFAVVDKIQQQANNIHTIRERYMNSASATPAAIFPTILKLSNHHREKLSEGSRIHYEKLIQEILDKFDDAMPTLLRLEDQSRFFLGYYQQMQDFYTPKSDKTDE